MQIESRRNQKYPYLDQTLWTFKSESVKKRQEGHYIIIEQSIKQDEIILNIYDPISQYSNDKTNVSSPKGRDRLHTRTVRVSACIVSNGRSPRESG